MAEKRGSETTTDIASAIQAAVDKGRNSGPEPEEKPQKSSKRVKEKETEETTPEADEEIPEEEKEEKKSKPKKVKRNIAEEIQKAVETERSDKRQESEDEEPSPEKPKPQKKDPNLIQTGVPGFDELLSKGGVPKGSQILLSGGPGSGKTIFGLQTLAYGTQNCNEKALYMTFEESEKRLHEHMRDFGWDGEKLEKQGKLVIKRYDPLEITRQIEAMLEQIKGDLLIDVEPIILPNGFKPQRIVVDSLSAIASAFVGKEEHYRIYIEQLFRLFERIGATTFLIAETNNVLKALTKSGVEEFLADGVIVLYNNRRGNIRESAIEILKLRGAQFKKKIVAMQITANKGIIVYPEQEVFNDVMS